MASLIPTFDPQTAAIFGLGAVLATYLAWFILFRKEGLGFALVIPTGAVIIALAILTWWPVWAILSLIVFMSFAIAFSSGTLTPRSQ